MSERNRAAAKTVAKKLDETRKSRGISQQQLASRLDYGQGMISKTLSGERRITASELAAWRLALQISWQEMGALLDAAAGLESKRSQSKRG